MNTKRKYKQVSLIILFVILLVACSSVSTQMAETAEPTATAKPSFTSTPSITNTPFQTRTPKADIVILEESASPSGEWTATITRTIRGRNYNLYFEVKNKQNNQIWVVENLDFTEPENPLEGYHHPYLFKWSDDGNYLYYSHLSTGGDGCYIPRKPGGFDFKRFDLVTGETVTIREGLATWMTLSLDEKWLAYVDGWGEDVNLLEIESKKEFAFHLPAIQNDLGMETVTRDVIWSPDGKTLIYAHLLGFCDYKIWFSYIFQVNPSTQQLTVLVEHNKNGYVPVEWNIQDRIILKDNDDNHWWLNPNTKEIVPAQP